MGPRSDNRGYVGVMVALIVARLLLQWVHGRITVVMRRNLVWAGDLRAASMGPRSDNRGYDGNLNTATGVWRLQWVHGRITVVMSKG